MSIRRRSDAAAGTEDTKQDIRLRPAAAGLRRDSSSYRRRGAGVRQFGFRLILGRKLPHADKEKGGWPKLTHFVRPNKNPSTPSLMTTMTQTAEHKAFNSPDEVREFPKGRVEVINIGGATVGRALLQPGWRWSESLQPVAKTRSCEAAHFQYHVSGVLHVQMDDGTEFDCKPGDVSLLPPGHDAWVVGNEPAVVVDFQGMVDFARAK